jgi:glycosyltransferase involved in cell wall biosynthesis
MPMTTLLWCLVALPLLTGLYAYAGYPLLLKLAARRHGPTDDGAVYLPQVSICLPVYNEQSAIRAKLENLLGLEYPRERLQIVVVSDASTDGTDAIVREYADRGVELVRLERRGGKTAAENAAIRHLRGEVVVNTDATIEIPPQALLPLVKAFGDPAVGVASGRDVSVGAKGTEANRGESGYVGYEMWVRSLETRAGSIVGASGCYYAIRRGLHRSPVPEQLSRDFASALIARENGYRAVSVEDAICYVPRTGSLSVEFRRKIRTMARGLDTLYFKKHLLNPLRHGRFAWMLFSHKLCRWLVPLFIPVSLIGLIVLATRSAVAVVLLSVAALVSALGWAALRWPGEGAPPRAIGVCGYLVSAVLAGLMAWLKALRGEKNPIWEPTRRGKLGQPG